MPPFAPRDQRRIPERGHDFDRGTHLVDGKTATRHDLLIASRMQIREPFRKFYLLAIDRNRTVGGFLALHLGGKIAPVDREKPADIRARALKEAGGALWFAKMGLVPFGVAEHKAQHVEEMHADIGRHPAGFGVLAFPGRVIPPPAGGDVGEVDLVALVAGRIFLAQRHDCGMKPKLQDGRNAVTGIMLDFRQAIDIPGIEHQRLLADRISPRPQGETAMRVMKMVGRADRDIVYLLAAPPELVDMPVETLELSKEVRVRKVTIENTDRVVWIVGNSQIAAYRMNSLHMSWCD